MAYTRTTAQQPPRRAPTAKVSPSKVAQAQAAADPRYNAKSLDRPGFSRGAGQMNQAGIQAAQNYASGMAGAYSDYLQEADQEAGSNLSYDRSREQYSQALQSLLADYNTQSQLRNYERTGLLYGLYGDIAR
jgi:hypothetical protein